MILEVYFDGAGTPQNKYMFAVFECENGALTLIHKQLFEHLEHITNNQAEYYGLIEAFRWLLNNIEKIKGKDVCVYGDSSLVINQVLGVFAVKNKKLRPLCEICKKIYEELKKNCQIHLIWVAREYNMAGILIEKENPTEYKQNQIVTIESENFLFE